MKKLTVITSITIHNSYFRVIKNYKNVLNRTYLQNQLTATHSTLQIKNLHFADRICNFRPELIHNQVEFVESKRFDIIMRLIQEGYNPS